MKSGQEITANIKNIKYYAEKIYDLARKQMNEDEDWALKNGHGIDASSGSIRFEAMAAIITNTDELNVHCDSILTNLKAAEEQDKIMFAPEEKAEETENGI